VKLRGGQFCFKGAWGDTRLGVKQGHSKHTIRKSTPAKLNKPAEQEKTKGQENRG